MKPPNTKLKRQTEQIDPFFSSTHEKHAVHSKCPECDFKLRKVFQRNTHQTFLLPGHLFCAKCRVTFVSNEIKITIMPENIVGV